MSEASENQPVVFTQDELGWLPWLEPFPEAELTERHFAGLVDKARAKSDYFRLLVRDPEVLEARSPEVLNGGHQPGLQNVKYRAHAADPGSGTRSSSPAADFAASRSYSRTDTG